MSSPKYAVSVLTFLLSRFCSTSTLLPGPASKLIYTLQHIQTKMYIIVTVIVTNKVYVYGAVILAVALQQFTPFI